MTNTQIAMIQAAASIEYMVPAKPKGLIANRHDQMMYSVFYAAAHAAYLRAAQECLNAAYDANNGGIDLEATHSTIADKSVSLKSLMEMCIVGYSWGGSVRTS